MSESNAAATSIQVLSRMFSLLDTLAHEGEAISLKSISERTGLHPSTAHRILNDLAVGKMVERAGPGSYRLGLRLLELGNLVKTRLDVKELAIKSMQDLHRQTGQSASLFVRQDDDALCIERTVIERGHVQVTRTMGLRLPLASSACGKVLLMHESGTMLQALALAQGVRPEVLHAELAQLRHTGLAQDSESGDASHPQLAAPIWDDQRRVVASLVIHVPGGRSVPEWAEALKAAAQRVSQGLGWPAN